MMDKPSQVGRIECLRTPSALTLSWKTPDPFIHCPGSRLEYELQYIIRYLIIGEPDEKKVVVRTVLNKRKITNLKHAMVTMVQVRAICTRCKAVGLPRHFRCPESKYTSTM